MDLALRRGRGLDAAAALARQPWAGARGSRGSPARPPAPETRETELWRSLWQLGHRCCTPRVVPGAFPLHLSHCLTVLSECSRSMTPSALIVGWLPMRWHDTSTLQGAPPPARSSPRRLAPLSATTSTAVHCCWVLLRHCQVRQTHVVMRPLSRVASGASPSSCGASPPYTDLPSPRRRGVRGGSSLRYRAVGLTAPPVHIVSSGAASAGRVAEFKGAQVVVAPQGSWLHRSLGHVEEAAAPAVHNHAGLPHTANHSVRAVAAQLNRARWQYVICGASSVATLHAAYTFAEDVLGVRFYPHGDVVPSGAVVDVGTIPNVGHRRYTPGFAVRGANTWGTWTEGFDWWTVDNWRGFITQLSKMKMNFIGMHSPPTQWTRIPAVAARPSRSPLCGSVTRPISTPPPGGSLTRTPRRSRPRSSGPQATPRRTRRRTPVAARWLSPPNAAAG